MSAYDKNGNDLSVLYSVNGSVLETAYDVNGNIVYSFEGIPLKVMSYNVGGWYIGSGRNVPAAEKDAYLALQSGMIEDNDPDILLIQEYLPNFADDGTSALALLQSLFPYVHTEVSGTYFGRAVCSKYPILNYTNRTYTAESSRYFDSCTIEIGSIPITVCTTHLGLTQANRDSEILQLIAFLNTQNHFICGGDFNTNILPNETTESTSYINNVKPFVDEGYNMANFGTNGFLVTYSDQPTGTWDGCLDNIITSSNISVVRAYTDRTKFTDGIAEKIDHVPIIVELQIN